MKNIDYKNWVKAACLGLVAVAGLVACSDDHFDVQSYGSATSASTIMGNIEADENLKDFAKILSLVPVKRNDMDQKTQFTYAELLNSSQSFTVWAPLDGTYDAKAYIDTLEVARQLRESKDSTNIANAIAIERKVENQFVRNHIARFNYESYVGQQQVRMLNSKVYYYDAQNGMFNGVKLVDDSVEPYADIASSNGAIHLLEKPSSYFYNIFDYMGEDEEFKSVYDYISASDDPEFSENLSTQGAMNENGEMVYVDSVYVTTNVLLNNSGADIRDEDSLYVAVIPTNEGFPKALDKMIPYFNYAESYNRDWNSLLGDFSAKDDDAYKIANVKAYSDSIARNAIITSMYFSASMLPNVDKSDSASVVKAVKDADSLTSTNNVVFVNKAEGENPMFSGAPKKASNGYIFKSDSYEVDPQYSFLTRSTFFATQNKLFTKGMRGFDPIVLNERTRNEEVKGKVPNNTIVRYQLSSTGAYVDYQLPAVYSGKYKISVMLAPSQILLADVGKKMDGELVAAIVYDNETTHSKKNESKRITVKSDTVKDYVLWEDYEFTRCYAGLPSNVNVFPRLRFTMPRAKIDSDNTLNVIRITIEPTRKAE